MKARLNLTIDVILLADIKAYANKKRISVSELVEVYFKKIKGPSARKSIINLVEELHKPAIEATADLKDLYYKDQAKKHGF